MKRFLWIALTFALISAATAPVLAVLVKTQDQIAVTIVVNVTPAPVAALPRDGAPDAGMPVAHAALRALGSGRDVDAAPLSVNVAVNTPQRAVRVEAEVTPNPNATELYSDQPVVTLNGTAGTTVVVPCAYHVTVDKTTAVHWQLEHGLTNDFAPSFPGKNLANNTYVSVPNPTATPFAVYADDRHTWTLVAAGTGMRTYCVDLTVNVPAAAPGGAYSSNAIYTLLF